MSQQARIVFRMRKGRPCDPELENLTPDERRTRLNKMRKESYDPVKAKEKYAASRIKRLLTSSVFYQNNREEQNLRQKISYHKGKIATKPTPRNHEKLKEFSERLEILLSAKKKRLLEAAMCTLSGGSSKDEERSPRPSPADGNSQAGSEGEEGDDRI
jgi:hypothetical protein